MTDFPPLTPPVDLSRAPPLHEMNTHPKRFEGLTAQLLGLESHLHRATLFGIGGEAQFGLDAIAERLDGSGFEGASCKCWRSVQPSNLTTWSDEFLKHLEPRWREQPIRRFILVTAAENITQVNVLAQVALERERFKDVGIEYEVWGPDDVTRRLSGDRPTTQRFLDDVWANRLCGAAPADVAALSGLFDAARTAQLHGAQSALAGQTDARVATAKEALWIGDVDAALDAVTELRSPSVWSQLSPTVQASVVRLDGSLALHSRDFNRAEALAKEADLLSPAEPRLASHAAALRDGAAAGLAVLGTPSTREGRQARAGLLLEAGQLEECATVVAELVSEDASDAESQRLLGWVRLVQGDRQGAFEAAERAEAIAPRWLRNIRLGAVVRYASALSAHAPLRNVVHPNPLNEEFVKGSDEAVAALEAALARFDDLLSKPGALEADRHWRLACLASLPKRRPDAEAYCRELLSTEPGCAPILAWAFMRDISFDRAAATAALAAKYESGTADRNDATVLSWLLAERDGPEVAATYLDSHSGAQSGEAQVVATAMSAMLRGQRIEAPPSEIGDGEDEAVFGDLTHLVTAAPEATDWQTIDARLASLFGGGAPSPNGLPFAAAVAAKGRWSALAPYVEVIASFDTPAAITLAAHVAHHTQSGREIVEFLDHHSAAFPGHELPVELRRIEVLAKAESGSMQEALAGAELIAAETKLRGDRLQVVALRLRAGDVQAAIPIIQDVLDHEEVSAGDAMRFSVAVASEDEDLARRLWRYSLKRGVPEELLLNAVSQGYRIGLDDETSPLMLRMQQRAAAGASDVWLVGVDDIVEHLRASQANVEIVMAHVEAGAVPIHMALRSLTSLARIYQLDRPSRDTGQLGQLYIRHAGRPIDVVPEVPWSEWQIHLDVTGLLIADQLDLLSHVERLAAPVIVSPSLPDALYQLEQQVGHQQPKLIEDARSILAARAQGRIATPGSTDLPETQIVRHERLLANSDQPGPTVASVYSALQEYGDLPSDRSLPASSDAELTISPGVGSRLHFADNTLATLTAVGGLAGLMKRFQCEIDAEEAQRLAEEVQGFESRDVLAERMRLLRGRVARGIANSRYVLAPARAPRPDEEEAEEEDGEAGRHRSPVEESLLDLICAPGARNGVLWVDDRHVSGFVNAEGNLIVGVVEVLNALVSAGLISADERRLKLLTLRQGGAVFIPMTAEEVLPPLLVAAVVGDCVVETPALAILRRNFSTALQVDARLKIGDGEYPSLAGRPDEAPFLHSSRLVLDSCLRAVWNQPKASLADRRARADWLWANLRMERCVRPLPVDAPGNGNEMLAALLLAGLLAGLNNIIVGTAKNTLQTRREYAAWLDEAVIQPRINDTAFLDLATNQLKGLLTADSDLPSDPQRADAFQKLRQLHVQMLPDAIRQRLLEDDGFAAQLGAKLDYTVNLGTERFEATAFWRASARALRGGTANVRSVAGKPVRISRDGDQLVLSGGVSVRLREGLFPGLRAKGEARTHRTAAYLKELDLAPAEAAIFAKRARAARQDPAYVEVMVEAERASVIRSYSHLAGVLRRNEQPGVALFMPPPAQRLMHHLRLDLSDKPMPGRVTEAWANLRASIGPLFAFRRLAGLPLPFGDMLAHETDAAELLELLQKSPSPMSRLHLARLAERLGRFDRAQSIVGELVEAGDTEGLLHAAVLTWTEHAFECDSEWLALSVVDRLALVWAHADRISGILKDVAIKDYAVALRFFADNQPPRDVGQSLVREALYDNDCACPDYMFASTLVYHGLGYVFGDADAFEAIPEEHRLKLMALLLMKEGDDWKPHLGVTIRSDQMTNCLQSFLVNRPGGLFAAELEPATIRETEIEKALATLETSPNDPDAWMRLAAVGRPAIDPVQGARVRSAFESASLRELAGRNEHLLHCRLAVDARRRFGGEIDDNMLLRQTFEIGSELGRRYPSDAAASGSEGREALDQAMEFLAVCAKAETPQKALDRLGQFAMALTNGWPGAAGLIRGTFDNLVRHGQSSDAAPCWRTFVALRAFP